MFCIVGLGNPGNKYQQTRHNAGFLVVDQIISGLKVRTGKGFNSIYYLTEMDIHRLLLVKPQTYMNLSGEAVRLITGFYKIPPENLLIILDDLDLPVGALRFRTGGSSGGHKGLQSIIDTLGTDRLFRLRIGIGRPPVETAVVDYVLTDFGEQERARFAESIKRAATAAGSFVTRGAAYTMDNFNRTPKNLKNGDSSSE